LPGLSVWGRYQPRRHQRTAPIPRPLRRASTAKNPFNINLLKDFGSVVHNHPSGDPSPSSADVDMTRQVVQAARSLQIAVHDHLVVGRDGIASLKALGLM
jgi:hypothetical protein